MKNLFKPLALTSMLALSFMLASCGDKPAEQANNQPAAEQQASTEVDFNRQSYEDTPSHVGWPEGTKLAADQVLRYNNISDPDTIDPSLATYADSFSIINVTFDTLVRKARDNSYIPSAATSWETSADGLTWTFHLRPEAKWQDGQPVTAKDFVYSWQRLVDPKTGAGYANYLELMHVKNAAEIVAGQADPSTLGVRAVDDYTFEITLTQPTSWLEQMVSLGVTAPLRQDIIEKYGDAWTKAGNYVGNGPFKLTEYRFKEIMKLEKVADYWGANDIALTGIEVEFISDSNSIYLGYLSGKYNIAGLKYQQYEAAAKERPQELYTYKEPVIWYYAVNPERVADPEVRKAFSQLLDRETIFRKSLKRHIPAYKVIPEGTNDSDLVQEYDWKGQAQEELDKQALEALAKAGYTAENPLKLSFPTTTTKDNPLFIAMSNLVKERTAGVVVIDPVILEGKAYYDFLKSRNFDFMLSGWNPDYDHISTFTAIWKCNDPNNHVKYCNPKYDELIDKADVTTDDQARKQLYADAVQILQNDYSIIPLYFQEGFLLKQPYLGGFNKDNNNRNFRDYYFIEH